jgi:hypothetical protein
MPTLLPGAFTWLEPEIFPVWRRRLELERRAGNITLYRKAALNALLAFHGTEGLWPSDAAVAALAGVSERTVRNARNEARELGLLTWERTRKRGADGRWRQGPNSYTVAVPASPVCPGGKRCRQRQERKKEAGAGEGRATPRAPQQPPQFTFSAATAALAARRAVIEARLRGAAPPQ